MTPRHTLSHFLPVFRRSLLLLALCGSSAVGQQFVNETGGQAGRNEQDVSGLMPSEGVLLLHNGEIIRGKISRVGDWYYVVVEGGEIRIRPDRVEFNCKSLEEGYRKKRQLIRTDDIHDRVRLAQWCIHHDLFEHAETELKAAATIDPGHPMLPLMRRQLEMASAPPPKSETPSEKSTASTPSRPRGPTMEELDRLVRGLPPGTVETFTRAVQPLLVNRCSTGACHGPLSEAKPRFCRFRTGALPSRRTTQRNLYAALEFVNTENPAASPLLRVPLGPHGDTVPLLKERDPQATLLEAWIRGIAAGSADAKSPPAPERVRQPHRPPIHAMTPPGQQPAFPDDRGGPGEKTKPYPEGKSQIVAPWVANSEEVRENRSKSRGRFVPRDPFDPEIFNRMAK